VDPRSPLPLTSRRDPSPLEHNPCLRAPAGRQPVSAELIGRIWSRDAAVWTGNGEAEWLGWLEAPSRELDRVDELLREVAALPSYDRVVLLGMGGSSLAPEVFRRAFAADRFHVLDTTHPRAVRRLADSLELDRTLFLVSSKSGGTLETRSHADFFLDAAGSADRFVAITDPGSDLERFAEERGFAAVFAGVPSIGGRYSALSPFGLVPAALQGVDVARLLERALEMAEACRIAGEGNPGLELGEALGDGWRGGRDKICFDAPYGFGLWLEQLLAESTGKDDKGLVPAPGEAPEGDDRQGHEVRLPDPYELGQEIFRWEFATAVAGHVLGINPFDQPNVQAAKDRTSEVLSSGEVTLDPVGSVDGLLAEARTRDYVAIQAFVDPEREDELAPLVERARRTGCVVTLGLGPRYLHSTGQLHKGGANTVLCLQVIDDTGAEVPIPRRPFGFGRLIQAQAAGDLASLRERGRRVARVRLEEVT
jgi:transaldolase / glucose-6-phosphate isomerase